MRFGGTYNSYTMWSAILLNRDGQENFVPLHHELSVHQHICCAFPVPTQPLPIPPRTSWPALCLAFLLCDLPVWAEPGPPFSTSSSSWPIRWGGGQGFLQHCWALSIPEIFLWFIQKCLIVLERCMARVYTMPHIGTILSCITASSPPLLLHLPCRYHHPFSCPLHFIYISVQHHLRIKE